MNFIRNIENNGHWEAGGTYTFEYFAGWKRIKPNDPDLLDKFYTIGLVTDSIFNEHKQNILGYFPGFYGYYNLSEISHPVSYEIVEVVVNDGFQEQKVWVKATIEINEDAPEGKYYLV